MGPWLANNIRECDGLTDMMSYWTFSDVFEEQGVVKTPFYGGYGLIAERHIPKAAFRVFELLHELGNQRVLVSSEDALVTKREDGAFVVALWNYAEPGEKGVAKTFHIMPQGGEAKSYRMQFVGPGHGSSWEAWKKLGSPALPTAAQIQELIGESAMPDPQTLPLSQPIVLPPQTLAVLQLER